MLIICAFVVIVIVVALVLFFSKLDCDLSLFFADKLGKPLGK
jgi:hypothetical protein